MGLDISTIKPNLIFDLFEVFFSHFEVLDLDILDEPRFKIRPIKFEVHIQYIWTSIE